MATDLVNQIDKQSKNIGELLAFIQKELDADAERHAKLQPAAAEAGEVLQEAQTGATIDLSKRALSSLPVEAIELMKGRVERLAVSHNSQIAIPSQIIHCDRLRYLNIRWNSLTQFPDVVLQLSKLEILDLSRNKITSVPEDIKKLTSLKFLAVAKNRITRLPYALGEMNSLHKLRFEENPLEFPPPDALQLSPDRAASIGETEKEKETCQKVKRFLRTAAVKEKPRPFLEEDPSEEHVETPRPLRRPITAGRFPIRPSISGLDSMLESSNSSPAESTVPPPIPQKSHARVDSSQAPLLKRPGIAPLLTGSSDANRSRSETVSSTISLRQRRQGFVPQRKPTGDLEPVSEDTPRLTQGSTLKPTHVRSTSSVSTVNSAHAAATPTSGRLGNFRKQYSFSMQDPNSKPAAKVAKRLTYTLSQLSSPITSIALAITDGAPHLSTLGRQLSAAQGDLKELGRLMNQLASGPESRIKTEHEKAQSIFRASVNNLRLHRAVTAELKRKAEKAVRHADGLHLRALMIHMHATLVEVRNVCSALGFTLRDSPVAHERPRADRAWSNRSVTPTQPKAPGNRRMPRPAMLTGVSNNAMQRAVPPPPLSSKIESSRNNTLTSQTAISTSRSFDTYSTLGNGNSAMSRTNTMRSLLDDSEGDEQFDRIFLKLQAACNLASQALPVCRREFHMRKEAAQNAEQRNIAQQCSLLVSKCEEVIANTRALKKRLEVVKVNDPGLRYQRDFWQLCDAFVHSWTELATAFKELSHQHVDVTSVKQLMRNVQRQVKDVSKTISNSPLYHHALGSSRGADSTVPPGLASPFGSGWSMPYHTHEASRPHNGYTTTSVPATPLSAALGPAAHAAMIMIPNTTAVPREYLQEAPTARQVRDRNDTPMQQPPQARRY